MGWPGEGLILVSIVKGATVYKAMHQSIRSSEKLAELSDYAYRVWSMGVVAADMVGRITANPRKFFAEVFPLLEYEEARLLAAFNELKTTKLAHFYEVDGKPYMVFHGHDEHNKGTKNLRNLKPVCPPPMQSACYCIAYTMNEEGDSASAVPSAVPSADGSTGVYVPSPVLVPVPVSEGDGGVEEGGTWPPMPATPKGLLWKLLKKAHITGTPSQLRQSFEGWYAQVGAQRLEQILMDPKIRGVDVFAVQKWFFNDILANSRRSGT
jgi:hypothetical protein